MEKVVSELWRCFTEKRDDADKLLDMKVGGVAVKEFTYYAAGRTTSITANSVTKEFAYDFESRLITISVDEFAVASFTYNGLDTRVGKVEGQSSKTYRRDGVYVTDPVLSDGSRTFTPSTSSRSGSTSTFNLPDYLGTVSRQVSGSETTTGTREYDAFGMPISTTGSPVGPFGFAGSWGYQEDDEFKLLGHRYYDASTGRFLTRDPIKDGRNWYAYCENNPLRWVDPEGLGVAPPRVNPLDLRGLDRDGNGLPEFPLPGFGGSGVGIQPGVEFGRPGLFLPPKGEGVPYLDGAIYGRPSRDSIIGIESRLGGLSGANAFVYGEIGLGGPTFISPNYRKGILSFSVELDGWSGLWTDGSIYVGASSRGIKVGVTVNFR